MKGTLFMMMMALGLSGGLASAQSRQVTVPGNGTLPFSLGVKADGLIYVAGTLSDKGDIKVQTQAVLDQIGQILTRSGSSLSNVVSATVYLTDGANAAPMTEVWRSVWPKDAPTRTTVVTKLINAAALVEISVVAVPNGGERVVINPQGWSTANPYSYAIRTGNTLFMSGLVARDTTTNQPIEGDTAAQTRAVMSTAGALLKAAGFGFEHVVSTRVYLTDGGTFQDMNRNYVPNFPKDPPARVTVVSGLPGPTYRVEMTMTAVRGERQAITTPAADGTPGKPSPTLSSAIKVGNRLYLSGLLGNTPQNQGDIGGQTRETLARIERTLKAAGFSWADVVDGTVYVTDVARFAQMNEAYRTILTKDFPARATVGTGLVVPDGLLEIMFVAVK